MNFLEMAVELAKENARQGGRPFGALLVKDGQVIAQGVNEILRNQDPTSHAELNAIRAGSQALGTPRLDGCVIYASGQPCPMCLSAMHMTGIKEAYFAYSNEDAEAFGLSTASVYAEMAKPISRQSIRIRQERPEFSLYEFWRSLPR